MKCMVWTPEIDSPWRALQVTGTMVGGPFMLVHHVTSKLPKSLFYGRPYLSYSQPYEGCAFDTSVAPGSLVDAGYSVDSDPGDEQCDAS